MSEPSEKEERSATFRLQDRHLTVGWWSLAIFALLGILLEAMHGFKVAWFLDPAFEIRRLLFRLAHAHGTLLSLVHLGFAAALPRLRSDRARGLRLASTGFLLAGTLLPLGFFLGGLRIYGGDPGPGIFLAPIGALCLIVAAFRTAWAMSFERADR
ncbi:MAG: hypothetical protein AAGC67_00475 [Myxococcota bacterium]